jgi:hypothetical protein
MERLADLSNKFDNLENLMKANQGSSESAALLLMQSIAEEQKKHMVSQTAMMNKLLEIQEQHAAQLEGILFGATSPDNDGRTPRSIVEMLNPTLRIVTKRELGVGKPAEQLPTGRNTKRTLIFDEDSPDWQPDTYDAARLRQEMGYLF